MTGVTRRTVLRGVATAAAMAAGALGPLAREASGEALKIGATSRSMAFFPLFAAQKKGFFQAEGLQVEVFVFGSSSKATQALISDSIHVGHTNPENVFRVNPRGGNLKLVAGLVNGAVSSIVAQGRFKTVADLRGGRLAVTNIRTGPGPVLTYTMERHGLRYPADYSIIEVPGTPDIWAAIQKGVVEGGLVTSPVNFVAADKGYSVLADAADVLPEYQFTAVQVRAEWASRHRDALVRYLKAYVRTCEWFHAERDEVVALIQELSRLEPRHARMAWDVWTGRKILPPDGRMTLAGLRANWELVKTRGDLGADAPPPEQHVDESFLQEARRQLGRSS